MKSKFVILSAVPFLLALTLTFAGCGKKEEPSQKPSPPAPTAMPEQAPPAATAEKAAPATSADSAMALAFKDKTLRFVVGFAAGGGYDTYSRAIARHISKHIPGNPTTLVENMDGAGSLIAAHYMYRNADPDGLTIGVWNSAMVLRQALGDEAVKIDSRRFGWIGAPSVGLPTCAIMGFSNMKTLDDVLNSKKRIKMGATRAGSSTDDVPKILNLVLKTNFDVISGFKGTSRIRIAMQKREIDGACWGWESMRTTARAMLDEDGEDKFVPFLTHGQAEDPEVRNLPKLVDLVRTKAGEKGAAMMNAYLQQYDFQRPLTVAPHTPKNTLATLRRAFKATLEDPQFQAEAKNSKLIITYVPGEQVDKLVDQVLATPAEAKNSLQFLVRGGKVS